MPPVDTSKLSLNLLSAVGTLSELTVFCFNFWRNSFSFFDRLVGPPLSIFLMALAPSFFVLAFGVEAEAACLVDFCLLVLAQEVSTWELLIGPETLFRGYSQGYS